MDGVAKLTIIINSLLLARTSLHCLVFDTEDAWYLYLVVYNLASGNGDGVGESDNRCNANAILGDNHIIRNLPLVNPFPPTSSEGLSAN